MQLYSVGEKQIRRAKQMKTDQNRVFLIDDIKTIYLWFGLKASEKRKNNAIERASELSKKRKHPADIQMMDQGKEYGSFLAIMDLLKKGVLEKERRPELEIQVDDTLELLEAGLEPDFEADITLTADNLAKKNKSFDELCKDLAKIQLKLLLGKTPKVSQIEKKATEIRKSSTTYEEVCWLIAELEILEKKQPKN